MIKHYFKIWLLMARNASMSWLSKKEAIILFLTGKIVRYSFYFSFLYFLITKSNGVAGFNTYQALFFTATYTLVDTLSQFLFRNVYNFRQLILTGDFDLVLLKPLNPLFRSLMGAPDIVDLITIPPIIAVVVYIGSFLNPTFLNMLFYTVLILNAVVISMCFHILALALGVITLEVDNTIMVFRDLQSMGRLPIEIYKEPLRSMLTFVIPVGLMFSMPTKALIGIASPIGIISTLCFSLLLYIISMRFWQFALKKYTSASS